MGICIFFMCNYKTLCTKYILSGTWAAIKQPVLLQGGRTGGLVRGLGLMAILLDVILASAGQEERRREEGTRD